LAASQLSSTSIILEVKLLIPNVSDRISPRASIFFSPAAGEN